MHKQTMLKNKYSTLQSKYILSTRNLRCHSLQNDRATFNWGFIITYNLCQLDSCFYVCDLSCASLVRGVSLISLLFLIIVAISRIAIDNGCKGPRTTLHALWSNLIMRCVNMQICNGTIRSIKLLRMSKRAPVQKSCYFTCRSLKVVIYKKITWETPRLCKLECVGHLSFL